MPADEYQGPSDALTSLGTEWEVISPDDDNDLSRVYKYIAVGATAGSVRCHDKSGTVADFYVEAGGILQCRPTRILDTGTDATPIIGIIR